MLEWVTDLGWERDSGPCLVLKAAVPPSMTTRVLSLLPQALEELPRPGIIADPGFGLVRLMWRPDALGEGDVSVVVGAVDRMRTLARSLGGSVVAERAPQAVKRLTDVWGGEPEGVEIMATNKGENGPRRDIQSGPFRRGYLMAEQETRLLENQPFRLCRRGRDSTATTFPPRGTCTAAFTAGCA